MLVFSTALGDDAPSDPLEEVNISKFLHLFHIDDLYHFLVIE